MVGFSMLVLLATAVSAHAQFRSLNWSGYTWIVRDTGGNLEGPGPGVYSDSVQNVWVDAQDNLHLKIRQDTDGDWLYSEVYLDHSLSFGRYEWEVASRYDAYAPNVVAGLFTYLSPQSVANQTAGSIGNGVADTPHEIDIELTRGFGAGANLFYTTHDPDVQSPSQNFSTSLNGDYTTHRFVWSSDTIEWESFHGHVAGIEDPPYPLTEQRPGATFGDIAYANYDGPVIPQDLNERVHINFWALQDGFKFGPSDGNEYELIVKSFAYTPLADLPIPEPGTLLVMGGGALVLFTRRWRLDAGQVY